MSVDRRARAEASGSLLGFVLAVGRGARADRITGLAAEVAFFVALSIVPALVAVAAALTFVPRFGREGRSADVEGAVVSFFETLLTEEASVVVDAVRDLFDRSNGDIFTAAVVIALLSGSRGIDAVIKAIVLVANDEEARPWWKRRVVSFGLLVGTVVAGATALSMFVVGPLLGGARDVADNLGRGEGFAVGWRFVRFPLGAIAVTLWSVAVLHVARPHARSWRADLIGAAVTTTLWILLSIGLRVYLGTFGRSNPAVGALGGPVILLLWLYLLALALLIGAEVAQRVREGLASPAASSTAPST